MRERERKGEWGNKEDDKVIAQRKGREEERKMTLLIRWKYTIVFPIFYKN